MLVPLFLDVSQHSKKNSAIPRKKGLMEGNAVDSATQTSDHDSDNEPYAIELMPNVSHRAVIDTSQPFQSVEEAVIRFGGRGSWIPDSILAVDAATATTDTHKHETKVSDINKLKETTVALLKDLQLKEKETHDISQELLLTKRLVEDLKLKLPRESPEFRPLRCFRFDKDFEPEEYSGPIMSKLQQAKLNLFQNNNELAAIRESLESLSTKTDKEKSLLKNMGDSHLQNPKFQGISRELRELNYEAEQFMKTAEAAKSEVIKAMSEIEQTKTGLKALSSNRISLSLEEFSALTDKARKAERWFKRNSIPLATSRNCRLLDSSEIELELGGNGCRTSTRPTTCIGEILTRKLEEDDCSSGRERVTLNQMLRPNRKQTNPQRRGDKIRGELKGLFSKRKGLGLVHISFPLSRNGKNKIWALNRG